MSAEKPRLLIIYYYNDTPMRASTRDHLFSFENYPGCECVYLNMFKDALPDDLDKSRFDFVLFHNSFLARRWRPAEFAVLLEKTTLLKRSSLPKAILIQDEYYRVRDVERFISEFNIGLAFTCARHREWEKIYPNTDFSRVKFVEVLTGYLDEKLVESVTLKLGDGPRSIDIGYRSIKAPAWWGRHGYLKTKIAEVFKNRCGSNKISTDISTRLEDTKLGDAWYDFLLDCRFMLGAESGTSVIDRDGMIEQRGREYVDKHPEASFDEIEKNIFPGQDGGIQSFVIGPRHLEACLTKTCQILTEGEYEGILIPGRHYIAVRQDFSNVEDVLEQIADEKARLKMVEKAYDDIILSQKYVYARFVALVLDNLKRTFSIK